MTVEQWLGKDNKLGQDIWRKKYQKNGETFDEWLDRVSNGNKAVRQLIIEKKFLPGGRILSNLNVDNDKAGLSNCFSRGFIEDDYNDIMQAAVDIGKTFKAEGGQGLSLSKLRPKGCPIGHVEGYVSDGIIPFMKIYNEVTEGTSQGGCIYENELVLTPTGYKPIKNVAVGDEVYTKKGFKRVLTVWDKGEKDSYKVTTKKGYSIISTIDHKYCIDGFNTVPLSTLTVGDKICLITGDGVKSNATFDEKAYFFAHFLANGYINKQDNTGTITLHSKYKEIGDQLISFLHKKGFNAYYNNRKEENAIRIILTVPVCKWILQNVEKDTCFNIKVPKWVMNGNVNTVVSFLCGAIDSDGSINGNGIKYCTVCKEYAEQIAQLMKRIGFFPTLYVDNRINEKNKHPLYEVWDSIRTNTCLPWSYKIINSSCGISKNSRYTTPYTIENCNLTTNETPHLKKIGRNQNIGLYTYLQIGEKAPFVPMIFDTIESIEPVGIKHVYDIEVEDEHKFFCNGFYVSNSRKGALLMSLDAWHKEIMDFITIKSDLNEIQKANLSVEIDDEFMEVVIKDLESNTTTTVHRVQYYGPNNEHKVEYDVVPIEIFKKMAETVWSQGEPGTIYVNRFRNYNIMEYCNNYKVETCNPCGEQPLEKHGACNLSSINLSEFVLNPYTDKAEFDYHSFEKTVRNGIDYLDSVIDYAYKRYALKEQQEEARKFRNCGLGVLGYATMLMKLGIKYGSIEAQELSDGIFYRMFRCAVEESSLLASRLGDFPEYNEKVWESSIIENHFSSGEIEMLKAQGLRNCSLLSIAPTGSIATLIGESGGVEPEFAISYTRRTVGMSDNEDHYYQVFCKAAKEYIALHPEAENNLPDYFIASADIDPIDRVAIQGIIQDHIDTAISSTVNLKNSATIEDCMSIYAEAWKHGLKGITIFRDGCERQGILTTSETPNHKEKDNQEQQLKRGDIIQCSDDLIGRKRKLISGCGSLHVLAYFDPATGEMQEVYLNKGSTGGCANFMTGLSRTISLLCRAGVDVYTIKDQLDSTGACPSYAIRSATKHDTSKGSCCPMAVGNALVEMWEEVQDDLGIDWEKKVSSVKQEKPVITTESSANLCPECGEPLVFEGGCDSCKNCGYSHCG